MGFRSIAPVPGNSFGGTRGALLWAAWAQRALQCGFVASPEQGERVGVARWGFGSVGADRPFCFQKDHPPWG
jgi:hypothetical protein